MPIVPRDILDQFGRRRDCAAAMAAAGREVTENQVTKWATTGRIPGSYWPALARAAQAAGHATVTVDLLEALHARARDGEG